MLDIFDLVFARHIIVEKYSLGKPLIEQLADIDYLNMNVGKIPRLDELIETAKLVSR